MCSASSSKRTDCVSQASAAASSDGQKNPPRNNRARVSGSMALSAVTSALRLADPRVGLAQKDDIGRNRYRRLRLVRPRQFQVHPDRLGTHRRVGGGR